MLHIFRDFRRFLDMFYRAASNADAVYSDENSVCLSVGLSACQTRGS